MVEHDHRGAAIVKHQPPEVRRGAWERVGGHNKGGGPVEAVCEGGVDVVVALPLGGD